MRIAVYLPILLPALAGFSARWMAARIEPRRATMLFTGGAVLLATANGFALFALAATVVGQWSVLATLGHWSAWVLHRDDPASRSVAMGAGVVVVLAVAAAISAVSRRVLTLNHAARTAKHLPNSDPVVLDDPDPDAYALPGAPGRIVVTSGMFSALDAAEREVVLAHERAHLAGRHHIYVSFAQFAAATNPLLRPLASAVSFCVERWADEQAARAVGDRRAVALAIGKAALISRHRPGSAAALGVGFDDVRSAGPVPRRVAALLARPPRRQWMPILIALGVLALAIVATAETARDLDFLFDLAEVGSST